MSKKVIYCNNPSLLKTVTCMVCDTSGNLYAANYGGSTGGNSTYVVKIDTAGNATLLTSQVTDANYYGMYYLNGYLYVCGSNQYVYQISVTTGVRTTIADFTSLQVYGTQAITYFAPYFYITSGNGTAACVVRMENTTWVASKYITYIAGTFTSPIGITVDKNGNLYIDDISTSTISKYDTSGAWVSKVMIGTKYKNILIYNENLYISYVNYAQISRYELSGILINAYYVTVPIGTTGLAFDNEGSFYTTIATTTNGVTNSPIIKVFTPPALACFKEDSLILTNKGYVPIQDLRKGNLIKTINHDFLPIDAIGYREIHHYAIDERIKDQLYKCSKDEYPQLIEDLILTGCHSILVDEFSSPEERESVKKMNGNIYRTENAFRLPACLDNRASVYEIQGKYKVYHFALENDNNYSNYGIYANGLLVETSSKRCLKEKFNMLLIE